jgi:hypothetical protein
MSESNDIQALPENTQGQSIFSLQLFDHAQRVANMLSKSALIPKEYQSNIPNAMIALEMANRIGASPLMVMQNLYVVYGKPSWSSKFVIAAINTCGRFAPLRMQMLGDAGKENRSCIAWTTERGIQIPIGVLTLDDAKKAGIPVLEGPEISYVMAKAEGWVDKNGSKWKTMPELMFRYRAASFFGNLYCPEILMGMKTVEETIDIGHSEEPKIQNLPPRPESISLEDLKALYEENFPIFGKKLDDNAKRIITKEEVDSYDKLAAEIRQAVIDAEKQS